MIYIDINNNEESSQQIHQRQLRQQNNKPVQEGFPSLRIRVPIQETASLPENCSIHQRGICRKIY